MNDYTSPEPAHKITSAKSIAATRKSFLRSMHKLCILSILLLGCNTAANCQWGMSSTSCATSGITGLVIGTTGSYSQTSSDDKTKVFDGDINTSFDGPTASGVWAGQDFGSPMEITCIKFRPRNGFYTRMDGGKFQVSDDGTTWTDLYTIPAGTITQFQDYYITSNAVQPTTARYARYLSGANGYGNIAEVKFYGQAATTYAEPLTTDVNTNGHKFVGKDGGTKGLKIDTAGWVIVDTNMVANIVYARSVRGDYNEVVPDYVFEDTYNLMPLKELEAYIKQNKHLPDVPSDAEYKHKGSIDLTELNLLLLRKVEELTLHMIELEKKLNNKPHQGQ